MFISDFGDIESLLKCLSGQHGFAFAFIELRFMKKPMSFSLDSGAVLKDRKFEFQNSPRGSNACRKEPKPPESLRMPRQPPKI